MGTDADGLLTPTEYLAFKRQSELRHAYVAGEIQALAGSNRAHSKILINTATGLEQQLAATSCELYMLNMRVKIGSLGIYTYPDITIVCGESALEDSEQDTLLNPTAIIEVLSPSTERYDRDLKFRRYRLILTLRDYLLIAQDEPRVEHYMIAPDGDLSLRVYRTTDTVVDLPTLGCRLPLAEVYARIAF